MKVYKIDSRRSKVESRKIRHGETVTFRRWTRKSYAVFGSLGRQIRIGVLSFVSFLTLLQAGAQEASDTIPQKPAATEYELDEVVVSAQRAPVFRSELMRMVQVVSRTEIERSPAHDIAGILQHVRGVDIRKRGAFGMQADVGIRGGTFDQTLILVNGINLSDPQTGHHSLNLPFGIQNIDRIEVLNGPGARIFGPNAFSGAINIITREPDGPILGGTLNGGQYGFGQLALHAGFVHGGSGKATYSHFLSGGRMASQGHAYNTDFNTYDLYYRGVFRPGSIQLDVQAGYMEKAFGANSFYSPRFPDQFEETAAQFASLKLTSKKLTGLQTAVYWRKHSDRFELFRHEAPEWYAGHNHHLTNVAGIYSNYSRQDRLGRFSIGVDYRYEHILSNVLGKPLDMPVAVKGYNSFYTHSFTRNGLSLMLEHSVNLGKISVSGGMLAFVNPELDKGIGFFPGLDLGWQVHQNWRWIASVNRTLRLPTFTDLFYAGPTNLGNAELLPEEALSLESGIRGSWTTIQFDFGLFHRRGKQMIDWVRYPDSELWQSMNHTEVNISGLEAGVVIPLKAFQAHALRSPGADSHPFLQLGYSWAHARASSGELVSNYALDHMRHKVDIGLHWLFTSSLGGSLKLSWRDRAGGYMHYDGTAFTGMKDFNPFWMADLKLFYDLGSLRVFAEAMNLLNVSYSDIANVPQPGIWMTAGIAYNMPFASSRPGIR